MMKRRSTAGFTIIELLIATVVFSIILLILAGAIIQIGRIYTKGLTNAHTHEVTRNLVNGMAAAIQLTAGNVTETDGAGGGPDALCIGSQRYSFTTGEQVLSGSSALVPGVIFDTPSSGDCLAPVGSDPASLPTGGSQVLGERMRLAYLSASSSDNITYTIEARVVYGDDDLLCDDDTVSCSDGTTGMNAVAIAAAGKSVRCKDIHSGTQFCSISDITTTVERRIPPNE
jgi:prepilin-type N-terminal cleavage/methylation domain-containing protein